MEVGNLDCLKTKTVLVVGGGGLGGYVIEHIARSEVGKIIIMDGDSFNPSNLDRQILCRLDNIGQNKAIVAADRISKISKTKSLAIPHFFNKENAHYIKKADVVVDCVDNVESRLLLEKKCAEYNKTLIHGALAGMVGQVAVISPLKPVLKSLYSKNYTKPIKTLSCYPAVVASIQASQTIKFLLNKPTINGLFVMDFETMSFDTLKIV